MGRKTVSENNKDQDNSESSKRLATPQALNAIIKSACDILRRSNCAGAMQYVPELTWILFLRILDEQEEAAQNDAAIVGDTYTPSLEYPYRWRDWGATTGEKRRELNNAASGDFFAFIHNELLPHLHSLGKQHGATSRQQIISFVMAGVEKVRVDTEKNFLDVLDQIHKIRRDEVDNTHVFTLSQIYENLLLKMGEKGNDGGQFFTPREVIRAMVRAIDPKIGETIYDPCCGTGGFLAQSFEYINTKYNPSTEQITTLGNSFYGQEKDTLIHPIALANLMLHGIDNPQIVRGNTLAKETDNEGLFATAPDQYEVILTNPPFGGKEGKGVQDSFDFKSSSTQVLFLQHIIRTLKNGGRSGVVFDEGILFKTNEDAFVQTKKKLLVDCDLWCIVSLPGGVFTTAGAGVKTNLLFFTKGKPTERIWYYDLSSAKINKGNPMTLAHFDEFFRLLPERGDSENSWTVDFVARKAEAAQKAAPYKKESQDLTQQIATLQGQLVMAKVDTKAKRQTKEYDACLAQVEQLTQEISDKELAKRQAEAKAKEIEDAVYDIKAVNPHVIETNTQLSAAQLIEQIRTKGDEIAAALATLQIA
jgi:type I restriction enzyme M protein